jgi:phage terminase Nu1 subunit (DNA packaging protein)
MTVSEKQMIANRQNALKSTGPKTAAGKVVASRNALKHGLLAKEVVITAGEGAENAEQFNELLTDLVNEFAPAGVMEEILVEKIAACYWRLRRAGRYEVGLLRQTFDTLTDDYYAADGKLTDEQIDAEIAKKQQQIQTARDTYQWFRQARSANQEIAATYHLKENWKWFKKEFIDPKPIVYEVAGFVTRVGTSTEDSVNIKTPQQIHKKMNEKGHTDDQIWQMLMELCQKQIDKIAIDIKKLQKQKADNVLNLQRMHQAGSLPPGKETDNLLRYETAIERQMYQALKQLERSQRIRCGHNVPAPVQLDVNLG